MTTMTIPQMMDIAREHHRSNRLHDAENLYRKILAQEPNNHEAIFLLGWVAHQVGSHAPAADLMRRAIALHPGNAEYHHNLAVVLMNLDRVDEALEEYFKALAIAPNDADLLNRLGIALKRKGRMHEALAAYQRALAIRPQLHEAWNNLGTALAEMGRFSDSLPAYRQALALRPELAEIHNNMGNALKELGRVEEAVAEFQAALKSRPELAELHNNLANVYKDMGNLELALDGFRTAVRLRSDYLSAHDNLLFTLNLDHRQDPESIRQELLAWNRLHGEPLKKTIRPHPNTREPDRQLRVGYVSNDFREHVVGWNMLPLLREHDRSQIKIYGYSGVAHSDGMTELVRARCDAWRSITGASDEQAAEMVRADGIDILVDLTLHAAGSRLLVFARKPAPVQVTYLGYCGSTGLDTMDYRLSDPYLDPPETDLSYYSEKTIRLPNTYWCYETAAPTAAVGPLPAREAGYVTFGCLNNFAKATPVTQELWTRIMLESENSRLILFAAAGPHRQELVDRFARAGVDPQRIEFVPKRIWREYTETYNRIDICLDPFPYGGGITTCDALWMGVPVVTLSGRLAVGRGGRSLLNNVGLGDLVAMIQEDYVRMAVELGRDVPRMEALRAGLRQRMQSSPLTNARQFARDVEAAYRLMWKNYCEVKK